MFKICVLNLRNLGTIFVLIPTSKTSNLYGILSVYGASRIAFPNVTQFFARISSKLQLPTTIISGRFFNSFNFKSSERKQPRKFRPKRGNVSNPSPSGLHASTIRPIKTLIRLVRVVTFSTAPSDAPYHRTTNCSPILIADKSNIRFMWCHLKWPLNCCKKARWHKRKGSKGVTCCHQESHPSRLAITAAAAAAAGALASDPKCHQVAFRPRNRLPFLMIGMGFL